jgi:hypothetical protein
LTVCHIAATFLQSELLNIVINFSWSNIGWRIVQSQAVAALPY